jgi:molybdenum cofactor cytidylyltransferase
MSLNTDLGPKELAGVVLAAGASNRLGQPKQLVTFDGRSLLQHAVEKCLPVCPLGVFVVTGAERESVGKILRGEPVQIVHNKAWRDGLASSITTGIAAVPDDSKAVLLMLCDQPKLSAAELAQLVSVWAGHPDRVVASRFGATFGAPAIFPREVFPMLEALRGDRGAKSVIGQLADSILVDVPGAELDIDRPEDLDRLRDNKG